MDYSSVLLPGFQFNQGNYYSRHLHSWGMPIPSHAAEHQAGLDYLSGCQ